MNFWEACTGRGLLLLRPADGSCGFPPCFERASSRERSLVGVEMAKLLGRIWAGKVWPLVAARPTLPRDSDISLSEESTDELKINSQYRIKYSVTTAESIEKDKNQLLVIGNKTVVYSQFSFFSRRVFGNISKH